MLLEHLSDGLHEIHKGGLMHRDLKPANVFLCKNGTDLLAKLGDFGISREV